MTKLKVIQYRSFKYTRWPHAVFTIHSRSEYVSILFWLKCYLKESQYRVNYDRNAFKWFPNSVTHISYHFKDSGDLLAMKLKFGIVEAAF